MAFGIDVFDSAGNRTLEGLDRLYRLYAVYSYNFASDASAFQTLIISCPPLSTDGKWKAYLGASNHDVEIFNGYFVVKLMAVRFNYATNPVSLDPTSFPGDAYIFQI